MHSDGSVSLWDTLTMAVVSLWEGVGVRATELLQAEGSSGFHMVASLDDELAVCFVSIG